MIYKQIFLLVFMTAFPIYLGAQFLHLDLLEKVEIYVCSFNVKYKTPVTAENIRKIAPIKVEINSPKYSKYYSKIIDLHNQIVKVKTETIKSKKNNFNCKMLIILCCKGKRKQEFYISPDGEIMFSNNICKVGSKAIYDFMDNWVLDEFKLTTCSERQEERDKKKEERE